MLATPPSGSREATRPITSRTESAYPTKARLATLAGKPLCTGTLHISWDGSSAILTSLDQPGAVAAAYFVDGLRDVVLRLADGRSARERHRYALQRDTP